MLSLPVIALSLLFTAVTDAAPAPRQNGLQVISNCYNNGQVALTFDGEC